VGLPIPLWQSGGAPAAAARARADQATAQLREVRADATRLLAQATVRVQETARRALVARDSVLPLAVRQRELALVAYQTGETGIVPVLDALRAEREVVRDLVADLVAYQAARADWLALIGTTE
ncbi:MAG: TolC family protein, partial [Gemmatimonadales bacterium]|nr:TolC family protein [Gemmatimonadales bacterium]